MHPTDKAFDAARYQYKLHESFGGRAFNGDGEVMTWLKAATDQAQTQHTLPSKGNLVASCRYCHSYWHRPFVLKQLSIMRLTSCSEAASPGIQSRPATANLHEPSCFAFCACAFAQISQTICCWFHAAWAFSQTPACCDACTGPCCREQPPEFATHCSLNAGPTIGTKVLLGFPTCLVVKPAWQDLQMLSKNLQGAPTQLELQQVRATCALLGSACFAKS